MSQANTEQAWCAWQDSKDETEGSLQSVSLQCHYLAFRTSGVLNQACEQICTKKEIHAQKGFPFSINGQQCLHKRYALNLRVIQILHCHSELVGLFNGSPVNPGGLTSMHLEWPGEQS